jgi:hypothetical protein
VNRRFAVLVFVALMSIAGCSFSKKASLSEYMGGPSQLNVALVEAAPQRYIAERHKVEIITPESDLQKAWESAVAYCGTIRCEDEIPTLS